jgi:hypothetical protein
MRFQDLVLKRSQLPTGNSFQDHMNSIQKITSSSYLFAEINSQVDSSVEINSSANLVNKDMQVSVGESMAINITNELN